MSSAPPGLWPVTAYFSSTIWRKLNVQFIGSEGDMCSYDVIAVAYFNVHLSVLCQLFRGIHILPQNVPACCLLQIHNTFRLYHCLHLSEMFISETKIRSIRLLLSDLWRGRRICADDAILMIYFELNCIIAYLALITEILCIIINEERYISHVNYMPLQRARR